MNKFKLIFRLLNIIWSITGISVVLILVTSTKGHPPGIVFVPSAVAIWIIGHVLLWLILKLAIRGNQLAVTKSSAGNSWPITLVLLALIFGAVSSFGFFGIILQIMFEHNWQSKLPILLLIWLPPSICLVGILLRQSWSRFLAGGGFIIVAIYLLYQMLESLMLSQPHTALDWLTGIVVLIVCVFLGQHILRSPRIKEFML